MRVGLSKPVGVILPPLRGLFLLVLKARPGYFVGEHNEHPGVNRKLVGLVEGQQATI